MLSAARERTTILGCLLVSLILSGLLVACGDTASNPSPTGATPASSAATPGLSQTSNPATTSATTTAAESPAGNSSLTSLLSLLPQSESSLKDIHFVDYAALRQVYGIKATSFKELQADQVAFQRWVAANAHADEIETVPGSRLGNNDPMAVVGFDPLSVEAGLQVGEPPGVSALIKGKFDATAIGASLTKAGATQATVEGYPAFSLGDELVATKLEQAALRQLSLTGYNQVAVLADKRLLATASQSDLLTATLKQAAKPQAGSLLDNPAVRAMTSAFGEAPVVFLSNDFSSPPGAAARSSVSGTAVAGNGSLPPAVLGGLAWVEPTVGQGYYLLADYYADSQTAQRAQPLMENLLRNGADPVTTRPFKTWFAVESSEVRGNLTLFKLRITSDSKTFNLLKMVFTRSIPIFWS